jgi:peptidoglycan-associated lipoprotein
MKVQLHGFIVALLSALLGGCSSTGGTMPEGAVIEEHSKLTEESAVSTSAADTKTFGSYSLDDPNSPLAQIVIYFEYDSSELLSDVQETVAAHGAYLADNPNQKVTLEGHADERGSSEYNIGLGDQRAQSVRRILELQGATPDQITIVSYGEEKPATPGHSEAAWRLNRRVEFIYQSI